MEQLTPLQDLSAPLPICKVRDAIDMQDRTNYELLLLLEDRGFTWQSMPGSKTKLRNSDSFVYPLKPDEAIHPYQKKFDGSVRRSYLLALLNPDASRTKHTYS